MKDWGESIKNELSFVVDLFDEVCDEGFNLLLISGVLNVVVLGIDDHDFTVLLPVNPSLVLLMNLRDVFQSYSFFSLPISLLNSLEA